MLFVCIVIFFGILLDNLTSLIMLAGDPPFVVARGGFSGIFPDSSSIAYSLTLITSAPSVILWCDVQLTKDEAGICFPDLKLDNASNILQIFKNQQKNYLVNGVPTPGWFSIDYTLNDLSNIICKLFIFSFILSLLMSG